ncbi:amine oxidase [Gracilaria domingensis]|nr:amine oxidase [Gracilaria domingensis]
MEAQVELQRAQSATTDRKRTRYQEECLLFDEVLDCVDKVKRAKDGGDEEVARMAENLLQRKKQMYKRFIEGVDNDFIVVVVTSVLQSTGWWRERSRCIAPAAECSGRPDKGVPQTKNLAPPTSAEIRQIAHLAGDHLSEGMRFSGITVDEEYPSRAAMVIGIVPPDAIAYKLQPVLTPDDRVLAEAIVKRDPRVRQLVSKRYGMYDIVRYRRFDGQLARLVQTFLYKCDHPVDNHYAPPTDILPVVDLNLRTVVSVEGLERAPPLPSSSAVNYHPDLLHNNDYLDSTFRKTLRPLQVVQPEGPSSAVRENYVEWEKWSFIIGFNYREGLVLHDIRFDNQSVVKRASLVEMAVPYADVHPPFERKSAFDVREYGLGYCANSLEFGCDCLGAIHYFDAVLPNSRGEPYTIKKAIRMHEEDVGPLYKHVEYRTGHSESRRARRLLVSFIATVVNYEYLFYWYLHRDSSVSHEIKLSVELSTNLWSDGEVEPKAGVMVAPGVYAQIHQHLFCAHLEMAVDGVCNSVQEENMIAAEAGNHNPYGNAFRVQTRLLRTEEEAQRDAAAARCWRVFNPKKQNSISGKTVAYKLVPCSFGSFQPPFLNTDDSAVSKRGWSAKKAMWVTACDEDENFPASEVPTQSAGGDGLPRWTAKNRSVVEERLVVWHSFGVTHVPRTEDFPVMPCESNGFSLKPDCFLLGNPGIDLAPQTDRASAVKPYHPRLNCSKFHFFREPPEAYVDNAAI